VLVLIGENGKRLGWELHAEGSTRPHRTTSHYPTIDTHRGPSLGRCTDRCWTRVWRWERNGHTQSSYIYSLYTVRRQNTLHYSCMLLLAVRRRCVQITCAICRVDLLTVLGRTLSPFTGSSCCTKTFCISVMKHINEIRATYRALKSCPINGRLNDQISGQDNDENGATCLVKSARGTCLVSRRPQTRH